MDHRYIDEHSVAARYIDNALTVTERAAFEAHLVDCQDCTDRILLAGMFHAQPDSEVWNQASRQVVSGETLPFRAVRGPARTLAAGRDFRDHRAAAAGDTGGADSGLSSITVLVDREVRSF